MNGRQFRRKKSSTVGLLLPMMGLAELPRSEFHSPLLLAGLFGIASVVVLSFFGAFFSEHSYRCDSRLFFLLRVISPALFLIAVRFRSLRTLRLVASQTNGFSFAIGIDSRRKWQKISFLLSSIVTHSPTSPSFQNQIYLF